MYFKTILASLNMQTTLLVVEKYSFIYFYSIVFSFSSFYSICLHRRVPPVLQPSDHQALQYPETQWTERQDDPFSVQVEGWSQWRGPRPSAPQGSWWWSSGLTLWLRCSLVHKGEHFFFIQRSFFLDSKEFSNLGSSDFPYQILERFGAIPDLSLNRNSWETHTFISN